MRIRLVLVVAALSSAALLFEAAPVFAQCSTSSGKLHSHVSPKQAYVFVDGKAIRDGSHAIELPAGTHTIGVYNYGYIDKVEDVRIESGKKTALDVTLQANGDKATGQEKSGNASSEKSAQAGKWMKHDKRATWLAYNRRVDIVLEPQGQQSAEVYPDDAPDARVLWARKEPSLKRVEQAGKTSVSAAQARTNPAGK